MASGLIISCAASFSADSASSITELTQFFESRIPVGKREAVYTPRLRFGIDFRRLHKPAADAKAVSTANANYLIAGTLFGRASPGLFVNRGIPLAHDLPVREAIMAK
jgi:hypothetical protein